MNCPVDPFVYKAVTCVSESLPFIPVSYFKFLGREHRIILTRDPRVLKDEAVTHGMLLREERAEDQAREVVERLQLESRVPPEDGRRGEDRNH